MVFRRQSALWTQFLPDHLPQGLFQRLILMPDIGPQGVIHHGLVVAAAAGVHLLPEPVQEIGVDPDGDAGLARLIRNLRAALPLAEIISFPG